METGKCKHPQSQLRPFNWHFMAISSHYSTSVIRSWWLSHPAQGFQSSPVSLGLDNPLPSFSRQMKVYRNPCKAGNGANPMYLIKVQGILERFNVLFVLYIVLSLQQSCLWGTWVTGIKVHSNSEWNIDLRDGTTMMTTNTDDPHLEGDLVWKLHKQIHLFKLCTR